MRSGRRWRTCTTREPSWSPSPSTCAPPSGIDRWVKPEEFVEHARYAEELGFAGVMSGPLVRSSYRAGRLYQQALENRARREQAPASAHS
jgi:hypothetical protein